MSGIIANNHYKFYAIFYTYENGLLFQSVRHWCVTLSQCQEPDLTMSGMEDPSVPRTSSHVWPVGQGRIYTAVGLYEKSMGLKLSYIIHSARRLVDTRDADIKFGHSIIVNQTLPL